jgi:hypothetical protein
MLFEAILDFHVIDDGQQCLGVIITQALRLKNEGQKYSATAFSWFHLRRRLSKASSAFEKKY